MGWTPCGPSAAAQAGQVVAQARAHGLLETCWLLLVRAAWLLAPLPFPAPGAAGYLSLALQNFSPIVIRCSARLMGLTERGSLAVPSVYCFPFFFLRYYFVFPSLSPLVFSFVYFLLFVFLLYEILILFPIILSLTRHVSMAIVSSHGILPCILICFARSDNLWLMYK